MEIVNNKEKETPATRQQRRYMERVSDEAGKQFGLLCNRFFVFFMEHNPTDPIVKEKQKELSAKWKMYCKTNNLIPEALIQLDAYCDKVFSNYESELNDNPQDTTEPTA